MKLLPSFRIQTLLAFVTCLSVLLALNTIPRHYQTEINYYTHGTFKYDATSFGWPYEYRIDLIGIDMPDDLEKELNPDGHEWINSRKKYNILENTLIALLCSAGFGIGFEFWMRRYTKTRSIIGG